MRDMDELRKEFENFKINEDACIDGSCETDETNLRDYPSYTEALYAQIVAPKVSGVYLSRWDIKNIASIAGDDMAIHPRKRMFELLMKYAVHKENMVAVLDEMKNHFEDKIAIYDEFIRNYPASEVVFQPKIDKARKTIALFPQIIDEYFE